MTPETQNDKNTGPLDADEYQRRADAAADVRRHGRNRARHGGRRRDEFHLAHVAGSRAKQLFIVFLYLYMDGVATGVANVVLVSRQDQRHGSKRRRLVAVESVPLPIVGATKKIVVIVSISAVCHRKYDSKAPRRKASACATATTRAS